MARVAHNDRWRQTATICATIINVNRPKNKKPVTADELLKSRGGRIPLTGDVLRAMHAAAKGTNGQPNSPPLSES